MTGPEPNPRLLPDAPIAVVDARLPFPSHPGRRRFGSSVIRLSTGRLLLCFGLSQTGTTGDGAVMISRSDDGGTSWDEPFPVYALPGWVSFGFGGLCYIRDDLVRLSIGRVQFDLSLGGPEPMVGWWTADSDSHDGGTTWSELGPELRLFPYWTEMYGTSNPHRLSDGRLLWAVIGTLGRDTDWRAGVTWSGPDGEHYTKPVVIAARPGLNFADTDLVRLPDGRFLAVIREMATKQAFVTHSSDEGRTWTEARPAGFRGANIKLLKLRSGLILCAYRDEDPERRGVSASVSVDGVSWRFIGQLYAADPAVPHRPSALCGYPDMVRLDGPEIACLLHSYPSAAGQDLHYLRLRDQT